MKLCNKCLQEPLLYHNWDYGPNGWYKFIKNSSIKVWQIKYISSFTRTKWNPGCRIQTVFRLCGIFYFHSNIIWYKNGLGFIRYMFAINSDMNILYGSTKHWLFQKRVVCTNQHSSQPIDNDYSRAEEIVWAMDSLVRNIKQYKIQMSNDTTIKRKVSNNITYNKIQTGVMLFMYMI